MNSVSAKPKAKHGIRHMTIEPAEGGVISRVRMHETPGKMMSYEDPPPTVHSSMEDLTAHVANHFGTMFPAAKGKDGK